MSQHLTKDHLRAEIKLIAWLSTGYAHKKDRDEAHRRILRYAYRYFNP